VFVLVEVSEQAETTGSTVRRLLGDVESPRPGEYAVTWGSLESQTQPRLVEAGVFADYPGASLTGHAFDRVMPGLGKWLVVVACWLFALSTIISWSYYGEQGMVFLCGDRGVMPYRLVYCALIMVSCGGWITTDAQLDAVSALGTGVMLFANIPIMLIFGAEAMRAYHDYIRRLKAGQMRPHAAPPITDVAEGNDV
jgi:AGCS family alanine or glycine:cation symporter